VSASPEAEHRCLPREKLSRRSYTGSANQPHIREASMGDLLQPWHILVISIFFLFPTVILGVIPFWFICKKAGYAPQLSLLNLVPCCLGTLFLVYFLALADWKASPGTATVAQPPQS